MSTNVTRAEKRTDCTGPLDRAQVCCHDAELLGVDGDGDRHFWSIYHQTVVVISDANLGTVPLPVETENGERLDTLDDWVDHHTDTVGWTDLRYTTDSLVDELTTLLEADQ